MLNIAICDDIVQDIILIKEKTEILLKELNLESNILTAGNRAEILLMLNSNDINILLLDINIPDIDGFEIAKRFHDKIDFIIFISSNDDLVYESIKYKPFRFVRKTHLEELDEALKAIKNYYSEDTYYVDIKVVNGGRISVKYNDILYIESWNGKLIIYTEKYKYEVRDRLKNIATRLNNKFLRVHRGFIINLDKVYQIRRGYAELIKGNEIIKIPIKRNMHNEIKKKLVEVMRK